MHDHLPRRRRGGRRLPGRLLRGQATDHPGPVRDSAGRSSRPRRRAHVGGGRGYRRALPYDQALALVPLALDWQAGDEVITFRRTIQLVFSLMGLGAWGCGSVHSRSRGAVRVRGSAGALTSPPAGQPEPGRFRHRLPRADEEIGRLSANAASGSWSMRCRRWGPCELHGPRSGGRYLGRPWLQHLLSGYGVAICYCSPRARQELDIAVRLARHHGQCRSFGHARL